MMIKMEKIQQIHSITSKICIRYFVLEQMSRPDKEGVKAPVHSPLLWKLLVYTDERYYSNEEGSHRRSQESL